MGLLRLLLALCVVFAHIGITFGYRPMGGDLPVTSFYIISGFYMTLILNEKYVGKSGTKLFLINRFLKIYSVYWAMLFLSFFIYLFLGSNFAANPLGLFFNSYNSLSGINLFSKVLIDIIRVITLIPNTVYFFPRATFDPLVIGPSWTLGLELIFYILAPLIARRDTKIIVVLAIIAHFLRTAAYHYFVVHIGNTTYVNGAFFPAVFFYFVLGILAYKIYSFLSSKKVKIPSVVSGSSLILVVLFIIFFYYVGGEVRALFLGILTLAIPLIFLKFKSSKWDSLLGNFSYTLYISHVPILAVLTVMLPEMNKNYFNLISIAIFLLFSWILFVLVEDPVDHFRHSIRLRHYQKDKKKFG
ncbi:MAG TPA: acyltransferase [Patescibacteria group bacterium]|nr:acyltransferase [Patescibacteria group bacterium]